MPKKEGEISLLHIVIASDAVHVVGSYLEQEMYASGQMEVSFCF
jgi:hypothetical protein